MKKKILTLGLLLFAMILMSSPVGAECETVSFECFEGAGYGYMGLVCGDPFERAWQEAVYLVEWCINVW